MFEQAGLNPAARRGPLLRTVDRYAIWVVLVVLIIVAASLSPAFLRPVYLFNLIRQAAAMGVVATGVTFVMVLGGVDLSVVAVMSLVAVLAAGWMNGQNALIFPAVLGCLGVGALVGLVNGLLLASRRMPPFILTLGMATAIQGFNLYYSGGTAYGALAPAFRAVLNYRIGPVPVLVTVYVALVVLAYWLLHHTTFGRQIYLVGANSEAARLSGIPIFRVGMLTYVLCGVFAALAGLVLLARSGVSSNIAAQGYEFDALAAVVMGGTTFEGGRGGILNTVGGTLVLLLSFNLVNVLGWNFYAQLIGKGVVIAGSAILYASVRRT